MAMSEVVARIDDFGRPAWIALMVLGFIVYWPIGLAILAYLLWSGRMGCGRHDMEHWRGRAAERWERTAHAGTLGRPAPHAAKRQSRLR
jgi:Protein of unknown function (DUF2852)